MCVCDSLLVGGGGSASELMELGVGVILYAESQHALQHFI